MMCIIVCFSVCGINIYTWEYFKIFKTIKLDMKLNITGTDKDISISKLTKILLFEDIDLQKLEKELSIDKESSLEAIKYFSEKIPLTEGFFELLLNGIKYIIGIHRSLDSQIRGDVTWNEYLSMVYFTLKVLAAIQKDRSFLDFIKSLFKTNLRAKFNSPTIFFICLFIFIRTILSLIFNEESGYFILKDNRGLVVKVGVASLTKYKKYIYCGDQGYELRKYGNEYFILSNDKKIGTLSIENENITISNISGKVVLQESPIGSPIDKDKSKDMDLGLLLANPVKENVDQSRKMLKDIGIDYNNPIETADKKTNEIISNVSYVKKMLTESNNLGYMGLFTKLIIDSVQKDYKIYRRDIDMMFQNIKELKPILGELRDQNLDKKDILNFDNFEELTDSLEKLKRWRIVNNFIKKIPSSQKNLIWENGYFKSNLKSKYIILENILISLSTDNIKSERFLKKISSIKDLESMVDFIEQFDDNDVSFNSLYRKIQKLNYAMVTYKNERAGFMICAVFGYRALKELTPGCNWCITRQIETFNMYTEDCIQYLIYRFDKNGNLLKDNTGIIGITVRKDFSIRAAHYMDDTTLFAIRFGDDRYHISPELTEMDLIRYNGVEGLGVTNRSRNFLDLGSINFSGGVIVDPDKFKIDLRSKNLSGLRGFYKKIIYYMNTNSVVSTILAPF